MLRHFFSKYGLNIEEKKMSLCKNDVFFIENVVNGFNILVE